VDPSSDKGKIRKRQLTPEPCGREDILAYK